MFLEMGRPRVAVPRLATCLAGEHGEAGSGGTVISCLCQADFIILGEFCSLFNQEVGKGKIIRSRKHPVCIPEDSKWARRCPALQHLHSKHLLAEENKPSLSKMGNIAPHIQFFIYSFMVLIRGRVKVCSHACRR